MDERPIQRANAHRALQTYIPRFDTCYNCTYWGNHWNGTACTTSNYTMSIFQAVYIITSVKGCLQSNLAIKNLSNSVAMTIPFSDTSRTTKFTYNYYCNAVNEEYKASLDNKANKTVYFHMKYAESEVERFYFKWVLYPFGTYVDNKTSQFVFQVDYYETATAWFRCKKAGNVTLQLAVVDSFAYTFAAMGV